ncbi:hypothetical protein ACX80D_17025 [Arthrobacter sp. Sr24]
MSLEWVESGSQRAIFLDQEDLKHPAASIRHSIESEVGGTVPLATRFMERFLPHLEGNLDQPAGDAWGHEEDEDLRALDIAI